jgi:hypothetical protein
LLALLPGAGTLLSAQEEGSKGERKVPQETQARRLPETVPAKAKPQPTLPSQRFSNVRISKKAGVMLPQLDLKPLLEEDRRNAVAGVKQHRIGVHRPLRITTSEAGEWIPVAGGRVWTISLKSPGAVGLRVHFQSLRLPPGATLFLYAPADADKVFTFDGRGPQGGADFWSPTLVGETVHLELFEPGNGKAAAKLSPLEIREVSHLYRHPLAKLEQPKLAGSCNLDATCEPAWAAEGGAVGRITFSVSGGTAVCTGTLLNNTSGDFSPYFLTANHCISLQSEAASAEVYWFYRTATCNGPPPSLASVPRSTGARFLVGRSRSSLSDFTLLEILGVVPRTATLAGWTVSDPPVGTAITGLHHPDGDYLRISHGSNQSDTSVNFHRLLWTQGTTEPGSSGSAIFNPSHQVVGQLWGGAASCANLSGIDEYGKFSKSYPIMLNGSSQNYLEVGLGDDAMEQNDTRPAAFTVGNGSFSGLVVKVQDEDWYRITVPAGQFLAINTTFLNAQGDVDLELFQGAGSSPVANALGSGNGEQIQFQNTTGTTTDYFLRVFLEDDLRNQYDMSVTVAASLPVLLTVTITGNGNVTSSPSGITCPGDCTENFTQNTQVNLTASASVGSVFSSWTGCDVISSTTCSVTMLNSRTVTATFVVLPPTPPPNDNFANAAVVVLVSNNYTHGVATTAATVETADPSPSCGSTSRNNSVWYRLTTAGSGSVTVDTFGSSYDTILTAWTGSPGALSQVVCNDDFSGLQSLITFTAAAGTTYYFMVSDYNFGGGSLVFHVNSTVGSVGDNRRRSQVIITRLEPPDVPRPSPLVFPALAWIFW